MKKILRCLFIFIFVLIVGTNTNSIVANAMTLNEIKVEDEYNIEVGDNLSSIPPLKIDGSMHYSVNLYEFNDTDFSSPIAKNVDFYKFDEIKKFRVCYFVKKLSGSDIKEIKSIINVVDSTKPCIDIVDIYLDKVNVNDTIDIYKAVVKDNSGENIDYLVKAYLNDIDVTNNINDSKIIADKEGTLKIVYSAIDSSGNTNQEIVQIIVENNEYTQNKGCNSNINTITLPITILIICILCGFILRGKNDE